MVLSRARTAHAVRAFVLVFATCAAALVSHVVIDAVGDVVLARDAYDALDHGSRTDVVALTLTIALAGITRLLFAAFHKARAKRSPLRLVVSDVDGGNVGWFVASVTALALPTLALMELLDVVSTGGRVDDIADLLGGSALLGIGVTLPVGALVAVAIRTIARFIVRSHPSLVAIVERFIALLVRALAEACADDIADLGLPTTLDRSLLARRFQKRGPPLLQLG
jgi:hypothetical protein